MGRPRNTRRKPELDIVVVHVSGHFTPEITLNSKPLVVFASLSYVRSQSQKWGRFDAVSNLTRELTHRGRQRTFRSSLASPSIR